MSKELTCPVCAASMNDVCRLCGYKEKSTSKITPITITDSIEQYDFDDVKKKE